MGAVADVYKTAKPDVAVVIGNDQSEIFTEENIPAFSVFWGDHIDNFPRTPEELAKLTPGIAQAEIGYKPLTRTTYACDPALGEHIIGSGGLTHYVIEEDFDRAVLRAMEQGDEAAIAGFDEALFASGGTAEIKNWIPVCGAMREAGFSMKLIDYVPCYRSPAGTGNAMAFAYWRG